MEITNITNGLNLQHQQKQQTQQQLNHINQLLSTAATGAGIVGDVDALLTPIRISSTPTSIIAKDTPIATTIDPALQLTTLPMARMENRPERNLWRTEEMLEMLKTMQQINAIELLNDKTIKSEKVFRNVEDLMIKKGFSKKSHVQIWTKWKFLKSTYTTSKRNGLKPKMIVPQIYDMLHSMLTNVNISSNGNGSIDQNSSTCGDDSIVQNSTLDADCGSSRTSMHSDSSNSARMVIADVESGLTELAKTNNNEPEDNNGLSHPIFGLRLVKQEPQDTGLYTYHKNI